MSPYYTSVALWNRIIMPRPTAHCLYAVIVSAALGLLAGCGSSEPALPKVRVLTEAEANARTVVPLTRTVALDKPGVIADFEFDLLPPPAYTGTSLVIGIRLKEDDVKAAVALDSTLAREGLPAKVTLQRREAGNFVAVELVRSLWDPPYSASLEPDGFTPGTEPAEVNTQTLRAAGLIVGETLYNVREFASPGAAAPGRYRLTIQLLEARPSLRTARAEVIIGYDSRAK